MPARHTNTSTALEATPPLVRFHRLPADQRSATLRTSRHPARRRPGWHHPITTPQDRRHRVCQRAPHRRPAQQLLSTPADLPPNPRIARSATPAPLIRRCSFKCPPLPRLFRHTLLCHHPYLLADRFDALGNRLPVGRLGAGEISGLDEDFVAAQMRLRSYRTTISGPMARRRSIVFSPRQPLGTTIRER